MIKPMYLDGMVWTKFNINVIREILIEWRGAHLRAANFQESIVLSNTVALLGHLADNTIEEGEDVSRDSDRQVEAGDVPEAP